MDFLVDIALFLAGSGLGYLGALARRPAAAIKVIASTRGAGGTYARFTRADGSVVVKKFAELAPLMEFRGVMYEAGEATPDGVVYNEVVSGR